MRVITYCARVELVRLWITGSWQITKCLCVHNALFWITGSWWVVKCLCVSDALFRFSPNGKLVDSLREPKLAFYVVDRADVKGRETLLTLKAADILPEKRLFVVVNLANLLEFMSAN